MALDLITFSGPYEVRERSAAVIRASFRDQAARAGVVPTNAYYRLDDDGTGLVLVDWTPLTMPVLPINYVDIAITGENNRTVISARELERKTLSVMANRGLAAQFVASYCYATRNLGWLS
jgi:hypothetical protein